MEYNIVTKRLGEDNMKPLRPEDYLEPECPLSPPDKSGKQLIPQQRISARLDELMARKQYNQAESMLNFWLESALKGKDTQGEFFVYNEMMGYYRKTNNRDRGIEAAEKALAMISPLNYENTISGVTCLVNAATVYTAFNETDKALPLFERAREVCEQIPEGNEYKLAAVYNNMATALVSAERYPDAYQMYDLALETLERADNTQLENAMTHLNIIDAILSDKGLNEENEGTVTLHLIQAQGYLDDETVERDDYYSFVADKCVGIFEYFGWSGYSEELRERIRKINEGN